MASLLLRRGRVIDPASRLDRESDILITEGRIARMGKAISGPVGAIEIDARDHWVAPGFIDLHTHLREPGEEYKEDIASGTAAAAAGGFTAICAMPNTKPVNDTRAVTDLILRRAREVGCTRVYPIGAITKGLMGEALTEIAELKEAGCVAVSDDGHCVMNGSLMRRALEYARTFEVPVIQHAEDSNLSARAPMNEGTSSTRAGLRGQPTEAESVIVSRDLQLVERTGARYHVAHVSTEATVRLVREAKRRKLPVSCEVTPHHLTLTDEACLGYDTSTKVNPPLRGVADVAALREALADGTIDAIATDHAPHSSVEKDVEYDQAAFGMIGLETALPLVFSLIEDGVLKPREALARLTSGPASVLNLPGGRLQVGAAADVVVIDPATQWALAPDRSWSKSRNSPFWGRKVQGRAVLTIVEGRIVYDGRTRA